MKREIRILIDEEGKTITVDDGAGNVREVQGIVIFGGDAQMHAALCIASGAPADAAWAAGKSFHLEAKAMKTFWRQCTCHIVQSIDPTIFHRQITVAEAEEMLKEEAKASTH